MLKKLLLVLLLSIPFASFGQQHVLFRDSTTIDSFRLTMWVRQLIPPAVPKINPFFDSVGSAYLAPNGIWWRHNGVVWQPLTTEPDSARWATRRYVDSTANSISAGAVDTNNYIASITRLNREIDSVSNIIDSNNTIIYGSISALYDTLPNYVDTAMLNDSLQVVKALINLKQNYSDTTTFDATRYYVDTAKANIRSGYVPYTGATTDVNIGTHNILTNSVRLLTSPTGTLTNVGQLYFDATNVTPSIPLNANVTLQIGQEEHVRARNNTGVQINDGQVVYINSAQGNNPTIALANSDSVNTSSVIGMATENIADNGTGFVTTFGVVNGYNTSGFTSGDILYLNTVSGQLSNTIPTPPHNVVKVGIALNSTNNGKVFIQPSAPLGQDTTFAAPYNSDKVAPTQRAIGTYTRKIVKDTASALRTAINTKGSGTVTSIQLVGGTNVTITPTTAITTSGVYTISATGGGSSTIVKANEFNMLYKANGDTTIRGTTKVRVDTTDLRMEFAYDADTATVTTDPHGGVKMWGSNRMGMGAVRINDTVSIPAALQRAVNAQHTSTMLPAIAATYNLVFTGGFHPVSGQIAAPSGTNAVVASAPSSIQHLNLTKTVFTTGSPANSACSLRVTSLGAYSGLIGGTTKFSKGGGRGTFTFSFPTYLSTERIMVGYLSTTTTPNFSGEPTTAIGLSGALMLIKESTDTTLFFYHKALNGAATSVNTGVVPNNEDVYMLTVYVSPTSTYYMQLEVLSRTGTRVITLNPTTNIQPPSSKFVSYQGVNNGTVGGAVSYGLIQMMEEIY